MDLPTYQAVIIQSRAQRAIKSSLSSALRVYGVTMMQWSIVGLIADEGKNGMRISDVAHRLDTSLAFITTSVNVLEAKGLVKRSGHAHDNRAKVVSLSPEFAEQIATIETALQKEQLTSVFSGVSKEDLAAYFRVLNRVASKN